MSVALLVIAIVVGLVILLLAIPIGVAFRFAGIDAFNGQIAIRWLFGLAKFRISIPDAKPKPAKPRTEPARTGAKKKPKPRRRVNVLAVLRQAAFRRRIYRFLKSLLRAAHARRLYLRLRLGLGDAADTGRLWAFAGPLNVLAQNLPNAEVRIEPEFADPVLEFETHGRFLLIPLQFIFLTVAFVLSPPSIRAWRTLRGSHA